MEKLKKDMKEFYSTSTPYLNQLKKHDIDVYGKYLSKINYYVPKKSKILDIGCGAGQVANFLASNGYNTIGVDISPLFIKEAQKGKAKFDVMDATSLEFPTASFEAVVSAESIEHILEPEKMLSEALRVLKPRGIIALRFPNAQKKSKQLKTLLTKRTLFQIKSPNLDKDVFGEDEDLCHLASTADIITFLKKNGCKIIESKPFFWRAGLIIARKQ
jgi:2-polyprenyl-3-methyl-5-hydroxy-6-metoxy-1,4-benzoquinol methylase